MSVPPSAADRIERVRSALGAEYEVLRPLGEGGMGAVYLARERALRRLVAIKVLDPDLGASPVFRARFEREAQTAAALTHPNIVPIFRVGSEGGLAFFVMQYVEGASLADRLRAAGTIPLAEALRFAREIATALGTAHRRGIIHRDIKPQNVLLDAETGRCMVTDFGIASVQGAARDRLTADEPLTGDGMVMGTPRYMSPEQASGARDLAPASDLYALGVLLYEMIAGAYPYKVGEPPNWMLAHLTQPVIPLVTRIGDIPREVEGLVRTLLAKEPTERYRSTDEVIADVDAILGDLGGSQTSAPGTRARLRSAAGGWMQRLRLSGRRGLAMLGLGVLAVGGGTALAFGVPRALGADDRAPDPATARRSILVGFFQNSTPDRGLDWLRIGGVEYLGQVLGRWQDLRVVDPERLLDLARRNGLRDDAPLSQDDAIRLARRADVWTTTVGSIIRLQDSLRITLRVYDVASRTQLRELTATAPDENALPEAFGRLGAQLLELAGAPQAVRTAADPPTRSVAAYRAFVEGVAARSKWQLDAAVDAFERTIRADSTFALGYYELSQALGARGDAFRGNRVFALADTAVLLAANRPEKEQLLLRAYQAYLRADFPLAGQLYADLLARDSLSVDALVGRADVHVYDRTLRSGQRRPPTDLTAALRLYERALQLDASDHRTYASLVDLLISAGKADAPVASYREPPTGNLTTAFLRAPARQYAVLLKGDSLLLVPSDSLYARFTPERVDSMRADARARAADVLGRWMSVSRGEGQPFLLRAGLRYMDRDFDGALRDLAEGGRRGATDLATLTQQRLGILLQARRFDAAMRFADSVERAPPPGGLPEAFSAGPRVSLLSLRGRVTDAIAVVDRSVRDLAAQGTQATLRRRFEIARIARPLRAYAAIGAVDAAQARSATEAIERVLQDVSDAEAAELRSAVSRSMAYVAASAGDTVLTREWQRRSLDPEYSVELAALAAANAGDLKGAARVLAALPSDTVLAPTRLFARAEVEIALGRKAAALRTLARLDRSEVSIGGGAVGDWVLLAVALERRAELREATGDADGALADYRLFEQLWADADAPFAPLRQRATVRRMALEAQQRGDGAVPAGTPLTGGRAGVRS